jgi:phospholipase C
MRFAAEGDTMAAQNKIEHVVVLMMENRSFDHMLGLYPNKQINGLLAANGVSVDPRFKNVVNIKSGKQTTQQIVPEQAGAAYFTEQTQIDREGFGGPAHSYPAATMQLFGNQAPPAFPNPAPLNGFAQSYYNQLISDLKIENPTPDQIAVPMTAFEQGQLPVLWQLAQEFCVCDQWYSEVPGPTQPNRLFVHAATSAGFVRNVWDQPFNVETVYEALEKVGRDWGVFYFDLRDSDSFPQIKKRVDRVLPFDSFLGKAKQGALPSYSFLCPRYNEPKNPSDPPPNSQHAPYDVRNGENLIADVYEALRGGPLWDSTLLIVTYDEHGGYFDHVSPPATNKP